MSLTYFNDYLDRFLFTSLDINTLLSYESNTEYWVIVYRLTDRPSPIIII